MKKFLFTVVLLVCILCCVFGLISCNNNTNKSDVVIAVVSIKLTATNDNQDIYTITYSDDSEDFFTVTNGKQGVQGIQGIKGQDGHTPVITIGSNGNWFIDGVDSLIKAQGSKGDKGDSGIGIKSIIKTATEGIIDIYTITFTDNSTTTFTVTNGEQGIQGIQGEKGQDGHTPIITIGSNGNWFIDGVDSTQKAQGLQGLQGLSAYELYIKNNPDYTKSEQEWLNDLACGHLGQVTITFDSNGGNSIEAQTIGFGTYAESIIPKKDGYVFKCWTLNGSEIDINTFTFFSDSTLVAKYMSKQFDITLNADGGNIENNTIHIQYGEAYSLPTPTKQYMSFANWFLGDVRIPSDGVWTYSDVAVQLKANYNTTKIYANLSVDENYGSLDTTREKLTVGEVYKLPVPTVVEGGLSFQGWYNGDVKYTDKEGNSLNILTDTETINLTASFYTEINDVYQIIALGSAESTSGNFVVTRDLDFSGLEMTPINNFTGVFDGAGHTLKNITINKGTEDYGGFFGTISHSSTIRNIQFDNLDFCGDWREWQNGQHFGHSGGLIGRIFKTKNEDMEINIYNISFNNSVNNSTNMSSGFGMIIGLLINNANPYPNAANYPFANPPKGFEIYIQDINISNSGCSFQDDSSYCIGTLNLVKTGTYLDYTQEKSFTNIYPANIRIEGLNLTSAFTHTNQVYGILAKSEETTVSKEAISSEDHYNLNKYDLKKIAHMNIDKFENNINGLAASISTSLTSHSVTINVSNSDNYGNTATAWGGVNILTNCINTGVCASWGASQSNNCFDVAEYGTYAYGGVDGIKNSLILFENADGSYYCFTSGGQLSVVSNITLVTKEWLISFLSFDERIWNLNDFDLSNKIYPTLKMDLQ